ncbi:hypothetical protein HRbin13_01362 [bacterium HR13]|nr:hypothetical protein HRbin13_01362 [bacterium HR13]
MKDKALLLLYITFLIWASSMHSVESLLAILLLLLVLLALLPVKAREKLRVLKRTFLSVFLFSLFVPLPYFVVGLLTGENRLDYLLMINARTFAMTMSTFMFLETANLFKALDFSKNLSLLLVLVSSHALSYARVLKEFADAFKSRSPSRRMKKEDTKHYLIRVLSYFFDKSKETSEDIYTAMKSRGFYHD